MNFVSRLLTIIVTATLTSAAWIVFGSSLFEEDGVLSRTDVDEQDAAPPTAMPPAEADKPEVPSEIEDAVMGEGGEPSENIAKPLDTVAAQAPSEAQTQNLVVPVLNVRRDELVDSFTDGRNDGERLHEAIDIMAEAGTTVVAAAPGTVEKLFQSDAGGTTIYVRSEDRETIHYYAHLRKYAEGLREGQKVRRGQRLGEVGSSGNAAEEAPHLHFAILRTTADAKWWEPATAINPYPLLTRR